MEERKMKTNDIVVVVSHPDEDFEYVGQTGIVVDSPPFGYIRVRFRDGVSHLFNKSELRDATKKEKTLYKTNPELFRSNAGPMLGLADFIPGDTRPCVMEDIYGTECRVGDMVIFASSYGDHGINMYKGTITAFGKFAPVVDALLPGGEKQTFRLQRPRFIKL